MARIKKSFRLSQDIVSSLNAYAEERGITFTIALERMVLKGIELENCTVIKEKPQVFKPVEEEIIQKDLNEDDMAMLDVFSDMPD